MNIQILKNRIENFLWKHRKKHRIIMFLYLYRDIIISEVDTAEYCGDCKQVYEGFTDDGNSVTCYCQYWDEDLDGTAEYDYVDTNPNQKYWYAMAGDKCDKCKVYDLKHNKIKFIKAVWKMSKEVV